MQIWQADFYRRPLQDAQGQQLWELLVCDSTGTFTFSAFCPQSKATSVWVAEQLQQAMRSSQTSPERVQVFRPQSLSLIEAACQTLEIAVEPTRRTVALKQLVQERAKQYPSLENYTGQPYQPVALDKTPPVPLAEDLWGDQWRFAAIASQTLEEVFTGRAIPILEMPELLLPSSLQLPATLPIPGVVIDGGRQSMRLARWLQEARPVFLSYISGDPDGLILEAGLSDRWVVATFADPEVAAAAKTYELRKRDSQGLHFLLVQPDDSGMTYSGFWLLGKE